MTDDDVKLLHMKLKAPSYCRAPRDGECHWKDCPQRKVYRKWCPLPSRWEDRA